MMSIWALESDTVENRQTHSAGINKAGTPAETSVSEPPVKHFRTTAMLNVTW